jgi:hypothetical protein
MSMVYFLPLTGPRPMNRVLASRDWRHLETISDFSPRGDVSEDLVEPRAAADVGKQDGEVNRFRSHRLNYPHDIRGKHCPKRSLI